MRFRFLARLVALAGSVALLALVLTWTGDGPLRSPTSSSRPARLARLTETSATGASGTTTGVSGVSGSSETCTSALPTLSQVRELFSLPPNNVIGSYGGAVAYLGRNLFANLYSGETANADGSVTVYVSCSAYQPLATALKLIPLDKIVGTSKVAPQITWVVVPASWAQLNAASVAIGAAMPELASAGYVYQGSYPDPRAGTLDVTLSALPAGATLQSATGYLHTKVNPLLRVIAVTSDHFIFGSPTPTLTADRGSDASPFTAGDRIDNPNGDGGCTSGFSVKNTYGVPRALTDAHCGNGGFTNGGSSFASTLEYYFSKLPRSCSKPSCWDVQTLGATDNHSFGPDVWIGSPGSQPTRMAVGGNEIDFPKDGAEFTFDGGSTGTVRYNSVLQAGADYCDVFSGTMGGTSVRARVCNLIRFANTNKYGVTNMVGGDSGGPVFCDGCYLGKVTPEGLLEAIETNSLGEPIYSFAVLLQPELKQTGTTIYVTP